MRLDDRVCLGWFTVEHDLRQGVRTRAPPVQHILRGGINVVYTRFKVDRDIMNALVYLRKKTGAGG